MGWLLHIIAEKELCYQAYGPRTLDFDDISGSDLKQVRWVVMTIISANAFLIILVITQDHLVPNLGIIGGEFADRYPFYVVVLKNDEPCGGSIIGSNTVATAATCVYRQDKLRGIFIWNFCSPCWLLISK